MMEYSEKSVGEAAEETIMGKLTDMGGTGGVIALDHNGNIAMTFNTEGMYRAYRKAGEKPVVKIFKD